MTSERQDHRMEPIDPKPFSEVIFAVPELHVESKAQELDKVIELLKQHGATYVELESETLRIQDVRQLTHIISHTSDFPDYELALDNFVQVVKPNWAIDSLARRKQLNPRQYSPDPCLIMSDVVICCAGIPEGDKEAIMGGVLAMGGLWSEQLTKMVTHLVALSLDDQKCQIARQKKLSCNIVIPHWFDDCLRLGKKISEAPYLLPNPEVLAVEHDGPPASRNNRDIHTATTAIPQQLPSVIPSSRRVGVFHNRKFVLAEDLKMGPKTKQIIEGLIVAGGGQVVKHLDEADACVCHYRDGPEYLQASKQAKDVGNLSWLYHLITYNVWTSPMRRLLHYPIPKNGIPGFQGYIITLSNYSGDARVYLENLIKATGATFTKTMKQENTHLITAHMGSEKCEAAAEWNINIVNHLWLEESYARNETQSLTVKRYTHFPSRTNLGEVVGQTQIDRAALEQQVLDILDSKSAKGHGKRTTDGQTDWYYQEDDNTMAEDGGSLLQDLHNQDIKKGNPSTTRKSLTGNKAFSTPASRRVTDEKENQSPLTSGSRGAKARAMEKLQDAAADMALYDKERKRVGGVVHGKDRGTASPDTSATDVALKKRKSSADEDTKVKDEDMNGRAKKPKTSKLRPIEHRLVLTMYDRWSEKPAIEQKEKNKLRNLQIHVVDDVTKATILCAPRIARTKKFLCALAWAPEVVSTTFLDYCLEHNEIPPFHEHRLIDTEGERRFRIKLRETVQLAKKNQRGLLKGWQILCTEKVPGGIESFKKIVEVNGGDFHVFKGRTNMVVSKRSVSDEVRMESQGDDQGDTLHLISGESAEETALWKRFKEVAKKADMTPVIVKPDWLLGITMAQRIYWNEAWRLPYGV